MEEFYKKRRGKVVEKIKELTEQRGQAGTESLGGIEIEISKQKAELVRLDNEIKAQTAKNVSIENIYFFVIVSTKEKVKTNLGPCCQHLNDTRYHSTDCSQWKPFNRRAETIQIILDDIKKGYPINPKYLDGELDDDDLIILDDLKEKSIAIVDLLSLDDVNKQTALKFDSKKSKLLLPLCRHLKSDVYDYADKIKKSFKTLSAYGKKRIDCMFFSDIPNYDMFSRHITHILTTNFPIKNQSNTPNPLRDILSNNNFQ